MIIYTIIKRLDMDTDMSAMHTINMLMTDKKDQSLIPIFMRTNPSRMLTYTGQTHITDTAMASVNVLSWRGDAKRKKCNEPIESERTRTRDPQENYELRLFTLLRASKNGDSRAFK